MGMANADRIHRRGPANNQSQLFEWGGTSVERIVLACVEFALQVETDTQDSARQPC